jgi:hypothetical protein
VSTLILSSGAATPSSTVNFCIVDPCEASSGELQPWQLRKSWQLRKHRIRGGLMASRFVRVKPAPPRARVWRLPRH